MIDRSRKDYLALAAALLAVSFSAIFIRFCESEPEKIAWHRLFGAGFIFLLWLLMTRRSLRLSLRDLQKALLAGFFLALHFYLWISSLFMTTIHSSVILLATQPLFALILQKMFRSAPIGLRQILSLTGGLAGAMVIAGGDFARGGVAGQGDLFAIAAAGMAAAYLFVGERRDGDLIPYLTVVYLFAGALLLGLTLIKADTLVASVPRDYLWFALLVIFPTLIGHTLLNRSTRIFSTYVVNLSILSEPILTGIWAWLIFREAVTSNVALGGAVILIAIAIEFWPRSKQKIESVL